MRSGAGLGGPGRVLGGFSAGVGLLLGILVGFREASGLSRAAPGLLLGRLGHSWAVLGGPWTFLGGAWVVLGSSWAILDGSWAALGAILDAKLEPRWTPRGAKSAPRPPKIEAKTVQDSLNM